MYLSNRHALLHVLEPVENVEERADIGMIQRRDGAAGARVMSGIHLAHFRVISVKLQATVLMCRFGISPIRA